MQVTSEYSTVSNSKTTHNYFTHLNKVQSQSGRIYVPLVFSLGGIKEQVSNLCLLFLQLFLGNRDNNGVRGDQINPPIIARSIRILPQSWQGAIGLRMELYGCTEGRISITKLKIPENLEATY